MLGVKLVRSLVLGETLTSSSSSHQNDAVSVANSKTPLLLFLPTKELLTHTHRLASLARDLGFDLHPSPSLSHILLSPPPQSSTCPSPSPATWSSTSLSSITSSSAAVPLPFPSLVGAPLPHLRAFVALSGGLFKLVFAPSHLVPSDSDSGGSYWDCCSGSLFSRLAGERIDAMEGLSRALAGAGWSIFKTSGSSEKKTVYLFRKVDMSRVRLRGQCCSNGRSSSRIRELRLPALDFRNAPLRILQYILLMTDDIFYIA